LPPPEARGPGALYLAAVVDAYGIVQELREDNNAFTGGLLGVGDGPDLTVTEVQGPASVQHGAPFTAKVKVCNQGTAFTSSYPRPRLEVYLSTDASVSMPGTGMPPSPPPGDQSVVASMEVDPLAPGQCTTLNLPASAYGPPEAPYDSALYLAAGIDAMGQVVELREDNNVNPGSLMGVGNRADLVVADVQGPASVRPGQSFSTQVKVCNQGTMGTSYYGGSRLELYLSTGNTLSLAPVQGPPPPPTGEVSRVATVDVQPLGPGQCVTLSVSGTAHPPPEAQPDAPLYLGAIIDAFHAETELREDNNVRMGGQLGVGFRSDLVVKSLSGPTSVSYGQPITVTVQVCNQGTVPTSGQPQVYLYLSTDTSLSMPGPYMPPQQRDQTVIGSFNLDPLTEGQCVTRSVSATAYPPPDAQPGAILYLGAIADVMRSETELREDNNARADFALQLNW
jgi:subtilase family serine protease